MEKKRNIVEWAMHYRQIVILITAILVAFGIYGLVKMNKNEFPNFTVRQGIVIAAYPGATSDEVEEQVTKPLEDYIFSYKEVKKAKTVSYSRNNMAIVQVELNDDLKDKDEFWSKFKHGVQQFKSELPSGVYAIMVNDDFGDTSSLLLTMESDDKTYWELNDYMKSLKDSLRQIESVGRLTVSGMQKEQISVIFDNAKLSQYGISDVQILQVLQSKGVVTTAGTQKSGDYDTPIIVDRSMNQVKNIEDMIVYNDPSGNNVRLKDVAKVKREYPEPAEVITNNGHKCLLLSVEIKSGRNITDMGNAVKAKIAAFEKTLPQDVNIFTITDQSKVVSDSVVDFLQELLIAIIAVVGVVMLLLPMRVALVAASTIPISIFISLGLFFAFGIELNTVTLAALIVTLGMIVDNSIVIIDNYMELLSQGMSRWHASITSATHFFKSILSATLAISVTFFPFLLTMKGMMHDFLLTFPWSITIVLIVSLLVAELLVPFLQFHFIRKPIDSELPQNGKKKFSFLDVLQKYSDQLVNLCFRHPYGTVSAGIISVILGAFLFQYIPQRDMPYADRNQFAVEIFLPTSTSLQKTGKVADSLANILRKDKRTVSVAVFKGCSSPRFQTTYAPQIGGTNFAQFIVNTSDPEATTELIADYRDQYSDYFPGAYVKFKQLDYGAEANTIEIRLSGSDWELLKHDADSLTQRLRQMPELLQVRNDVYEPQQLDRIHLKEDEASRIGVENSTVENLMALRYSSDGYQVGSVWNGDHEMPVRIKSNKGDRSTVQDILDEMVPANGGQTWVPLRQVADIKTALTDGQISHRNGMRTITVMANVKTGMNGLAMTETVQNRLKDFKPSDGVNLSYGGELAEANETAPQIISALVIAMIIIFFILLWHFKRVSTAVLLLVSLSLCLFGTVVGMLVMGLDFGTTCYLGVISLMGILVRNAIIMYDFAEELRMTEHLTAHQAIQESAKRRMRPIFLTSAAASVGVLPMVISGGGLWVGMGVVILFGTLITMFFILSVLPVAYWLMMTGSTNKRNKKLALENQ